MSVELKWMVVENHPNQKKIPEWQRSSAIDENGVVFAPAAICGNEKNIFLCALYDGVSVAWNEGHAYYPTEWLSQEFPETADIMRLIYLKIRGAANGV